ncbi:MAG: hypothetical protein HXY34_02995 [Candidatus Thorarchaeota archaeon]|nr:hypothetical protein [Candidatus Thorarchaeota archaeon]
MRSHSEQPSLESVPVVQEWSRMLNGPRGKSVLDTLDEGESFILQTSRHVLRVTKSGGKAVVELVSVY